MATRSFQVTLPAELTEAMERQVAAGLFDSVDALVQDGVRAMIEPHPGLEAWLTDEVAASCREMADPDAESIPLSVVADRLRGRIASGRA